MKNNLFIIVLFITTILLGCADSNCNLEPNNIPKESPIKPYNGNIKETVYKGHSYIIFEDCIIGNGNGLGLSALHSPDCVCMDSLTLEIKR